jgi:hypothetical protein
MVGWMVGRMVGVFDMSIERRMIIMIRIWIWMSGIMRMRIRMRIRDMGSSIRDTFGTRALEVRRLL